MAAILTSLPAISLAETLVVPATGSVPETVERLKTSIENAGSRVFTVVDFGGGAKSVGEDIGDLQLVVFGNPKIGAAALSADPMAALRLPAKVLVYDTGSGSAMAYEAPGDMLAGSNIPPDAPILTLMADALDKITAAAAE